jgi:hypothetical protein
MRATQPALATRAPLAHARHAARARHAVRARHRPPRRPSAHRRAQAGVPIPHFFLLQRRPPAATRQPHPGLRRPIPPRRGRRRGPEAPASGRRRPKPRRAACAAARPSAPGNRFAHLARVPRGGPRIRPVDAARGAAATGRASESCTCARPAARARSCRAPLPQGRDRRRHSVRAPRAPVRRTRAPRAAGDREAPSRQWSPPRA